MRGARRIVILTGAGISAESGISTFRDPDGVWSRYDLNEVATPDGFRRNPELVQAFYNARRSALRKVEPNAAHLALARLESQMDTCIVTQNVDDLHERAGSRDVLHMHGELSGALCGNCGHRWPAGGDISCGDKCPVCKCCRVRPDVVWFGEMPYHTQRIDELVAAADIFAAIGTSGEVSPANSLVFDAADAGARTIEFNLVETIITHAFSEARRGPAGEIVPRWVDELLGY
ncbi:MAG: NAD-dependent deacylase [Rhodobacteraceae bacterium]|nr:NAD-dependent deacylase [Paracoccaceae bacterium]